MQNKEYTATRWLEKYVEETFSQRIALTDSSFQPVWDFLFLWGLYEAIMMDNRCTVGRIWENVGSLEPNSDVVNHFYDIISNRYVDRNHQHTNANFNHLSFREEEEHHKEEVKKLLLSVNLPEGKKNQVCRMILWRYRNNLFHGKKELKSIWEQLDFFKEANIYLQSGLEHKTGITL